MYVCAIRRVEPILAEVEPALAVQERADLHQAEVIVGVAQREPADQVPPDRDEHRRRPEPEERHPQPPVPVEMIGAVEIHAKLALPTPLPRHRSEERRVGKEWVRPFRSRWSPVN